MVFRSHFQLFPVDFDEEKSCPLFMHVEIIPCTSTWNAMDIFHDMLNRNTQLEFCMKIAVFIPIVHKPTTLPLPVYAWIWSQIISKNCNICSKLLLFLPLQYDSTKKQRFQMEVLNGFIIMMSGSDDKI